MKFYETDVYKHNVSTGNTLWETLLIFFIKLLVYASLILPTGSIYGFNIKIALTVLVGIFVGADVIFKQKLNRTVLSLFVWFGSVLLFILWGWLIATTNGIIPASSLSQSIAILSTFSLVFFPWYLISSKIISPLNLLDTVIKLAFVYSLIKISMTLMIMLNIVSATELFGTIDSVFGYRGMTLETSSFLRINFPSDYIFPGALFISLTFSMRGKRRYFRGWFASGLYIIALILTYSRFLWVFGLVSALLAYAVNVLSLNRMKRIYLLLGLSLPVVVVIIALFLWRNDQWNLVYEYINERYSGGSAEYSDSLRTVMKHILSRMALEKPILGWGLGAYARNFVRFPETPWNYELQWLTFFMQFGLFGVGLVLSLLLMYVRHIIRYKSNVIASSGILFSMWLLLGFFNCFLLSSSAGVVYLLFFLITMINWNNIPT